LEDLYFDNTDNFLNDEHIKFCETNIESDQLSNCSESSLQQYCIFIEKTFWNFSKYFLNLYKNNLIVKVSNVPSISSGKCDEEFVNDYFNNNEPIHQVFPDIISDTESKQSSRIDQSVIDYRREQLWNYLILKNNKSDNNCLNLNMNEFNELLELITLIKIDIYDEYLLPLIGHHVSWYQNLVKVISKKHGMYYHCFSSNDTKNYKHVKYS
jgi:hypothetical protein